MPGDSDRDDDEVAEQDEIESRKDPVNIGAREPEDEHQARHDCITDHVVQQNLADGRMLGNKLDSLVHREDGGARCDNTQ